MFTKQFRSTIFNYLCENGYPNINIVADSISGSIFGERRYSSAWLDIDSKKCIVTVAKIINAKIEQPEMMEFVQH